jgi:thiol-disulfide isomerase/thioredoxin
MPRPASPIPPRLAAVAVAFLLVTACNRAPAPAAPAVPAPAPASASAPAPAATTEPAPKATNPDFPTLSIETWDDGHFDLAAQRGKWVVVNFWATWCAPCLKEIPDLAEFDARRDDVQVVGLAYEEIERADMEAFLKEHPIAYPFAIVDVTAPPADFGTPPGLPMTFLIAPDGKVAKKFFGPVTSAELDKLIEEAGKARS